MIMCVLLCYPVSIRIYYQQGGLFLVIFVFLSVLWFFFCEGIFLRLRVIGMNRVPVSCPRDENYSIANY